MGNQQTRSIPSPVEDALPSHDERRSSVLGHICEAVGNTPMVRLDRLTEHLGCTVLAKLEMLNPGGSSKDRIAWRMLEAAERDGRLLPGATIIEPTSGNTGRSLAMVAAVKGYRCVFVVPDKVSQEKIDLLRALGAQVVVTPTNVPPNSPLSYYRVAERMVEESPNAFAPNQYINPNNPDAHYLTTGPEIWEQTRGAVDVLVAGVGTGGTISGVARYLKERNPAILVVAADPHGSVYSSPLVHPYLVEGIGEDFWPETVDTTVIDRYVTVEDATAFHMARTLARKEGILAGGSAGAALAAALEVAAGMSERTVIVAILADGGQSYLSTFYCDRWCQGHGLAESPAKHDSAGHDAEVNEWLH